LPFAVVKTAAGSISQFLGMMLLRCLT